MGLVALSLNHEMPRLGLCPPWLVDRRPALLVLDPGERPRGDPRFSLYATEGANLFLAS